MSTETGLSADVEVLINERVPRGMFIGGQWMDAIGGDAGEPIVVLDPGTGGQLTVVPEAGGQTVAAAVEAASAAGAAWRAKSGQERARLLRRLADMVEANRAAIATLDSLDNGKPYSAAYAHDIPNAVATLRYFARQASETEYGRRIEPVFATRGSPEVRVTRVPLGVVAAVIPWNAPFMTAVWKLAPAVAFGNTIVLKPAEETNLSALFLASLVQEAGFADGVINVVTGRGATTGAALVRHPRVRKISFTGSTEVGRSILAQSSLDFRRIGLELGGKSASILFADAARSDIKRAVTTALWAVFVNSGQVCSAGSRLLVERSVYDEVVSSLLGAVGRIRVGYGLDSATQMGPLVSAGQLSRVDAFVKAPTAGEVVAGGQPLDREGFYYPPTVVSGVEPGDALWAEEVFGPVLAVAPFDDEDQAVALANDSQYGLAAGLITNDRDLAQRVAPRLDVGTVWVNTHNVYDPAVPWGGLKQSGVGRDIGDSALNAYTEEQALWLA
jgi:phenylacetaldehyde dehydrogenase